MDANNGNNRASLFPVAFLFIYFFLVVMLESNKIRWTSKIIIKEKQNKYVGNGAGFTVTVQCIHRFDWRMTMSVSKSVLFFSFIRISMKTKCGPNIRFLAFNDMHTVHTVTTLTHTRRCDYNTTRCRYGGLDWIHTRYTRYQHQHNTNSCNNGKWRLAFFDRMGKCCRFLFCRFLVRCFFFRCRSLPH